MLSAANTVADNSCPYNGHDNSNASKQPVYNLYFVIIIFTAKIVPSNYNAFFCQNICKYQNFFVTLQPVSCILGSDTFRSEK